jgi:hypothetical protein
MNRRSFLLSVAAVPLATVSVRQSVRPRSASRRIIDGVTADERKAHAMRVLVHYPATLAGLRAAFHSKEWGSDPWLRDAWLDGRRGILTWPDGFAADLLMPWGQDAQ